MSRQLCDGCIVSYGEHNALPADIKIMSHLKNDWHIYLCFDHAAQRGYVTDYGNIPVNANWIIKDITKGE